MILRHAYNTREEIPKGAGVLYVRRGSLFIADAVKRDIDLPNPWATDNWNLTAQGAFIAQHGRHMADVFAANAGTAVGATKPKPFFQRDLTVLIQRRNIGGSGSSDGGDDNALAVGLATKV